MKTTAKQRAAAKAYRQKPEYKARKNAARRKKYAEDAEYREQMKAAARATYHNDPWAAERIFARNYDMTLEEAIAVIKTRPDACELCGRVPDGNKVLSYDHCHKNGYFRGWLCHQCNRGLGLFKDNPDLLRLAAEYLEAHSLVN